MRKPRKPGLAKRVAVVLAVAILLAAVILLVPRVRGKLIKVFGPYYWEFKKYTHPYREVDPGEAGNGGPASEILLQDPMGIDVDRGGNIYVSDRGRLIWKIAPDGTATVVGGTGQGGLPPDGALALEADLGRPQGLCLDAEGRIYFADSRNDLVLRIEADGTLTRIAGTGERGFSGDGGPATDAALNVPFDVRVDGEGSVFITDFGNHRIRKVTPDGRIHTVAGTGEAGYSGDGGRAEAAKLDGPYGSLPTPDGGLLIADSGNNAVRRVDAEGIITTIAGTGERGFSGDDGPASAARLDSPQSLYLGPGGRIYVNDEHNHAIRVIDPDGTISLVVGTGQPGLAADGVPGEGAPLNDPEDLALGPDGSLFITDADNARVIVIDTEGRLRHIAGRPKEED